MSATLIIPHWGKVAPQLSLLLGIVRRMYGTRTAGMKVSFQFLLHGGTVKVIAVVVLLVLLETGGITNFWFYAKEMEL